MKIENPPAFPFPYNDKGNFGSGPTTGMSLRDWFAGQATLPAIGLAEQFSKEASPMPMAARLAYEFADAMLSARAPEAHSREEG
jgi:hypothetical protein